MKEIIQGFLRFQSEAFPARLGLFRQLAHSQEPRVLFIACSYSRVVPELLTQREPGDLFVIRNAGNIVPAYGSEPGGVSASTAQIADTKPFLMETTSTIWSTDISITRMATTATTMVLCNS